MMGMKKRIERIVIGKPEGKTLLERMFGGKDANNARPADALYNPLRLTLKDMVELTFEEAGTYQVAKIVVYASEFEETTFQSARYFLREMAAVGNAAPLVLELMHSDPAQNPDTYLFRILEEFAYDEEFAALLEDDLFVITEETDEGTVENEYAKTFQVTAQLKLLEADQKMRAGAVNVWNYERAAETETRYLTIEIDADNGWTTLYEGRKLLEKELEIYRLE